MSWTEEQINCLHKWVTLDKVTPNYSDGTWCVEMQKCSECAALRTHPKQVEGK